MSTTPIQVHVIQEKQYGRLVLFVEPGDVTSATVYLDGEEIGVAPGVFPNILVGKRSLRVSKEGINLMKLMCKSTRIKIPT